MLRRLGVGSFNGLSLFTCRRSIGQRSIHDLLPSCGHGSEPSASLPAAAAAAAKDPRWVLLNSYGCRRDGSFVADANTVADSHTTAGQHLRVSFGRAPPPASSFLYYDWDGSAPGDRDEGIAVVAAHGDSVLFEMADTKRSLDDPDYCTYDYFVYRSGAGRRPPSLSLLPDRDFTTALERSIEECPLDRPLFRGLYRRNTGLLRRGDDELMVVDLDVMYDRSTERHMGELVVLGVGRCQWELKDPVPIVQCPPHWLGSDMTVAVGDRFLCWVDYHRGVVLCDMADEASPKLRHVSLPPEVVSRYSDSDDLPPMEYSRSMGAAGNGTVRFVSVDTHCCCGGPGTSTCAHSRFDFTVTTWAMKLSMDEPVTWVKDGVLDCEELWALPGYEGLPRAHLECPVVSLDKPHVVCFKVSNCHFVSSYEEQKVWMIEVDMRSNELLYVVEFTDDPWKARFHLPTELQC